MDKYQAQNIIKKTFENPFDKIGFNGFVRNLLNHIEDAPFTYQGHYIPEKFQSYIKHMERIGKFSDGKNSLDILIITLQKETSLERSRTMQRNFIAWYLNGSRGGEMKDAALVAYVSPDSTDWRFSLVKMEYKFEKTKTGKVKVKEEFTPARRWSFLVGVNEKSHTAQSRLVKILANDEHSPTLAELEEAFNIETVTKEFFFKYRELFIRTKEALDRVVQNDPKVRADFEAKGVDTINFAKKLLGQIVFLYFLQKKGWFGVGRDDDWGTGSKHFLRDLFEKHKGCTGIPACESDTDRNVYATNNFFNDILEPLFYDALRRDRSEDDHYYPYFNCKIPFLNGGLFDPIGLNGGYDWTKTDICLPDKLFSNKNKTREGDIGDGILDVFDRYNFTVREDEPLEKEVAIDPELLGKAYEKFNAIRPDNFDEFTKALKSGKKGEENKFNKKFGVYYTPREIVHYMCQQSLINYLYTKVTQAFLPEAITRQDIEDLIEVGELITEHEATALIKEQNIKVGIQKSTEYTALLSDSIRENAAAIDQWLAEITVCDPAVGSGAFPVGMMNEIVRARNVLSVFLQSNGDSGIPACDKDSDTIHITRRNLPHWTKANAVYWITFRLADSLPQDKLNTWKAEREYWKSQHPEPWSDEEWKEYNKRFGDRLEKWLDAGYGSCALAKPAIREIVQECILRFNGERLFVHAGVIMPNHVHLLLEPLADHSLSELLKGIKGASSRKINQALKTTGSNFWMDESYDHIVRNEAQYQHFIRYIFENPIKANLSENQYWLYEGSAGIPAGEKNNTQTRMSMLQMSVPRSDYEFKRRCIEHSLYGVDIDPGAVEIAKLRLWLSLVVDEEDIKNIKPLPNLDYKIVCGNSLLGVKRDLLNDYLFKDLERLKPIHLNETNPTKKQEYKKQIDDLIHKITNGHSEFDFEVYFSEVFHQKGGFDVVIGNPPYVSTKGRDETDKTSLKNFYGFADDLYSHFYFKSIEILAEGKGHLCFISSKTFWTIQTKRNLREMFLKNKVIELYDTAKPFEAMVDTCVILVQKTKDSNNYKIVVKDGKSDLLNPNRYTVRINTYKNAPNNVFFIPTAFNMAVYNKYSAVVKTLMDKWWDKISTSLNIAQNKKELEKYRNSLRPGDITLLGLITEGGQGLATANNGKYIGVLDGTNQSKNIKKDRSKKLLDAILSKQIKELAHIKTKSDADQFLSYKSEHDIRSLFDELKEKYGRDIFGQGWLYRIVNINEIADVDTLTEDEKLNGIKGAKTFVPYDKGDKEGNRWYAPTPYYIDWSRDNVKFLKENSGKKGQGMPVVRNPQFYFREGFCWTDVNSTYLKSRIKDTGIYDVLTMSLFGIINIPDWYYVCIINSKFISEYVDDFINSTSHFQINDARQLPIIIPTQQQLKDFENIFYEACTIQKAKFDKKISKQQAESRLELVQSKIDQLVYDLYGLTEEEIKIVEGENEI